MDICGIKFVSNLISCYVNRYYGSIQAPAHRYKTGSAEDEMMGRKHHRPHILFLCRTLENPY